MYDDYEDGGSCWGWLIAIAIGACVFFGGCESKEKKEKKLQQDRIEQLEYEVSYLLNKIDKRR